MKDVSVQGSLKENVDICISFLSISLTTEYIWVIREEWGHSHSYVEINFFGGIFSFLDFCSSMRALFSTYSGPELMILGKSEAAFSFATQKLSCSEGSVSHSVFAMFSFYNIK